MPLSDKQQEFLLNCSHRWNIKCGATGSGKSYLDIAATIPKRIIACRGEGLIVMLGNTRGTLERNILEPMRELWSAENVGNIRGDNTVMIFGKKVYALGADNRKHIARIQGATIEYAYGDEVTTWAQGVFEMLKSRLRCPHSHFDGTCNPDNPNHWFKAFLDGDADIYQQKYVIDDGVLPPYIVAELKKEYAGSVFYDRYILGEWALAEGLIYPMYSEALVDALPEEEASDYCISIDYGTMNAFAALVWSLRGGTWYAERLYYYSGRDTGKQKTDADYLADLEPIISDIWAERQEHATTSIFGRSVRKIDTIIDPSAASFIALLRQTEWSNVIPARNSVLDGIRDTACALQSGKVKILKSLKEWREEAGGYVWDTSAAEDRPVKVNDHAMDATRYFIETKRIIARESRYSSIYAK